VIRDVTRELGIMYLLLMIGFFFFFFKDGLRR